MKTAPTPLAAMALLAPPLLAGCVGLIVQTPVDRKVENPVPHKISHTALGVTFAHRLACQPKAPFRRPAKNDYLELWGEPAQLIPTAGGETWIYGETGRWCGLWIVVIVPVPVMLPICETYDHVEFEGDIAVRSTSRRLVESGGGLTVFHSLAPLPLPFVFVPAPVTEGMPSRLEVIPLRSSPAARCPALADALAAASRAAQPRVDPSDLQ